MATLYQKTLDTADKSTNFGAGWYSISTWHTNNNANYLPAQGILNSDNTQGYGSRVGFFFLDDLGSSLTGKTITNIYLKITYGTYGYANTTKTLVLNKATQSAAPKTGDGVKGSTLVGDQLGTLSVSGTKSDTNVAIEYNLNSTSNTALFNAMTSYLLSGGNGFTIYNGETSTTSQGYSNNFLDIVRIEMTISGESPGYAYYKNNGTWVKCKVYYKNNGTWVQVKPYYKNNGTWTLV